MTNTSLQLHTAARRYCMDQHAYWCSAYAPISEKHGVNYTDEAYNTFSRYHALAAILNEIEKIDADHLPSFQQLSERLVVAAQEAQSIFTQSPSNKIEAAAIADERAKFCAYVKNLSEKDVSDIQPLPYRYVLSTQKVADLWKQVDSRWGTKSGGYWYPLSDKTDTSLFAFNAADFDKKFPAEKLQAIMRDWGIARLFELREHGDENYHLSLEIWEPHYNGAEGFWVLEKLDWIMYASHEGTITTGGFLTEAILKLCPDAKEYDWTQP